MPTMSGKLIMGNVADWYYNGVTAAEFSATIHGYSGLLVGGLLERMSSMFIDDHGWGYFMNFIVQVQDNCTSKRMSIVSFNGESGGKNYQEMRFALSSVLLGDAYLWYNNDGNGEISELLWFDEFNFHLGSMMGDPYAAAPYPATPSTYYIQQFEHGLSIVNPTDSTIDDIPLPPGSWYYLNGTQDPTANPGGTTPITKITLAGKDGRILSRTPNPL
jgi:hypothetical protein